MSRFLLALVFTPLLLAVGCATTAPQHAIAPAIATPVEAPQDVAAASSERSELPELSELAESSELSAPIAQVDTSVEPAIEHAGDTAPQDDQQAQDDYDAIYGSSTPEAEDANGDRYAAMDPWEHFNRKVHTFNNGVDHLFARPFATGYVKVVPQPIRTGVSNFYDNLITPLAFGNLLLQGRPAQAFEALGRFLVNSTAGIAGLFDPATKALKMHRHSADFGRTLARWGWKDSRYLELPLLGPRTVRDGLGAVGDLALSPLTYVHDNQTRLSLQVLRVIDLRAGLLPLDAMRAGAPDDYILSRDAWLARRQYLLNADDSAHDQGTEPLPAYLMEDDTGAK